MDSPRNGHVAPSSYLRYLPALYQQDPFVGRFLRIFEDILTDLQSTVNTVPEQFEPRLAPSPMLQFLASWVGRERPAGLPEERWRLMIRHSLWLHRWRGTRRGLRLALESATGHRPLITEHAAGLALGQDASLGTNTALTARTVPHINVTFDCPREAVDPILIHDIIREHKPGHIPYRVAFKPWAGKQA